MGRVAGVAVAMAGVACAVVCAASLRIRSRSIQYQTWVREIQKFQLDTEH